MPPISIKAVVLAFVAEFAADWLSQMFLFAIFAGDQLHTQMSNEEFEALVREVIATTAFQPWAIALGIATTVGGGYLAARLAKRIPYYHGLAMGIVGIVYIVIACKGSLDGEAWLGVLVTIPASLYGAHLARKQMPAETK